MSSLRTDPPIDVTGEGVVAAVASARSLLVRSSVSWLAPASRHTVFAALQGLREDVARLELSVVAHLEELRAFGMDGARSTGAWPEQHAGHSATSAKVLTRAVEAAKAPSVAAALAAGALSVEHAAALQTLASRVAEGNADAEELAGIVTAARSATVGETRSAVAKVITRLDDEAGTDASSHRQMTGHDTDHGTKVWRLELEPDAHATFGNAIQKLVDEVWRNGHADGSRPTTLELARLRADAAVEMARRLLHGTTAPSGSVVRSKASPEVIAIIDHRVLLGELEGLGRLADGTPIPGATARRLACEAGILPAVLGGASEVLDLGRATRLASVPQRKALLVRWCTCGFPGCTIPVHWTKAHHLDPWKPGGCTDIDVLLPLCERHHHVVHEGRWRIERLGDAYVFVAPDGTRHGPVHPNGRAGP